MADQKDTKAADRDEVLKRMLKMPPKPHKPGSVKKARPTKKRPKKG